MENLIGSLILFGASYIIILTSDALKRSVKAKENLPKVESYESMRIECQSEKNYQNLQVVNYKKN